MKKPDRKSGKYYQGHIFLDRKYLADIDKFIDYQQSQLEKKDKAIESWKKEEELWKLEIKEKYDQLEKEREEIKTLKAQLSDNGDLPQIEIKPISSTKYKYQLKTAKTK